MDAVQLSKLLPLALLAASPAMASDVIVQAFGTLRPVAATPVSGPFAGVVGGEAVELRLALDPIGVPGAQARTAWYRVNGPESTLTIGTLSDTFVAAPVQGIYFAESFVGVRDEILFVNRSLVGGDSVTLALVDIHHEALRSHELLLLRGSYPASLWETINFTAQADGRFLEFELTELRIGSFGPGSIVCAPAVANSTGFPTLINATGSDVLGAPGFGVEARGLPLQTFGFFLTSPTQANVPNPGGSQGVLCLGGAIGRYQSLTQNSGFSGVIGHPLDAFALATPGGPTAAQVGETWTFQAWYRDSNPTPTSNFTDAVAVTFVAQP